MWVKGVKGAESESWWSPSEQLRRKRPTTSCARDWACEGDIEEDEDDDDDDEDDDDDDEVEGGEEWGVWLSSKT